MKAILYRQYGPPEILALEDIPKPTPADNEVLLRIHAASVNPYDWHFMRGTPYAVRLIAGLMRPKSPRLGADVAGHIESIGKNVTHFKPGDAVFGTCAGSFAEFASTPESTLALKPGALTFEQAAAVPIAAFTALQALRDKGKIAHGQDVLINGAAGGVGTFAVQIAKSFGAKVTGVCSTRNIEMVRSLGADHVIDYTQQDFTRTGNRYDLILDLIGNHSLSALKAILNPKGICVGAGGPSDPWMIGPITQAIEAAARSMFAKQKLVGFLAKGTQEDLIILSELIQAGKLTPVIDKQYSLADVPAAIRYLEQGHARGKVVIAIEHASEC